MPTPFATDPPIVDLTLQRSSASGPGPFKPGMTVRHSDGGESVYLKAESEVKAGRFVARRNISTGASATLLLAADAVASEGRRLGVARANVSSGAFAFFAVKGPVTIFTGSSGWENDKPLFASDEAGTLTTTTASLDYVHGVQTVAIAASTTSQTWIDYPRIQRYGGGA